MPDPQTEARHPLSRGLHAEAAPVILSRVVAAQAAAVTAVQVALPALERAAEASAAALAAGGRLGYAGAGSSGLMALADALELPGTFGIAPDRLPVLFAGGAAALLHLRGGVEDDTDTAAADVARAGLGAGDVVLCLAASGGTPYTLAVARAAQAAGARVAGIACVADSPLLRMADIAIHLDTAPEIVAGSTRLGAAAAQKAALNALSVLVGVRLGHVHDGLMVNLTADNAKLAARAARIVATVAGTDPAAARSALTATHGAVKPAVLVALGLAPAAAETMLNDSGGHLAPALAKIGGADRPHSRQERS